MSVPMSASDSAGVATPWLQALLRPRSVAVVGASDDPKKDAARPVRFLRKHGYAGTVHAVNPRRDTVLGEKSWPALSALRSEEHTSELQSLMRISYAVFCLN